LLDLQNDLRNDFQLAVGEHVERVRDDAFGGIFHRHHAVIRRALADFHETRRRWFSARRNSGLAPNFCSAAWCVNVASGPKYAMVMVFSSARALDMIRRKSRGAVRW